MGQPAAGRWEVSLLGFDVLWSHGGLGEFPLVLQLTSHGTTLAQRGEMMRAELAALQRAGAVRDGSVHPQLREVLLTLAHPDTEVDLRGRAPGREWRVMGATRAGQGVLAVRERGQIRLTAVPAHQVVSDLVGTLGEVPPGPSAQLNVDAAVLGAALQRARGDEPALGRELAALGVEPASVVVLAGQFSTIRARATIGAAQRVQGQRRRNTHVVGVLDCGRGRYVSSLSRGAGGRTFTTIRPARPGDVIAVVHALVASAPRSAPTTLLRKT